MRNNERNNDQAHFFPLPIENLLNQSQARTMKLCRLCCVVDIVSVFSFLHAFKFAFFVLFVFVYFFRARSPQQIQFA